MKQLTKTTCCLVMALLCTSTTNAQSDFETYKQQQLAAFTDYKQQEEDDFKHYRDSVNQAFAAFLEEKWKSFDLQRPKPPIETPIPEPPEYDPKAPQPKPIEVPADKTPVTVTPSPPQPKPLPQFVPPARPEEYPVRAVFFGTDIRLKAFPASNLRLSGASEKDIAAYWLGLSKQPHYDWMNEALRIKEELLLNDWGLYQLLNQLFNVYFPQGTRNEQVVFSIFMLNQMGCRAKIGRDSSELIPLLAFQNEIYNCAYFPDVDNSSVKYWVINPTRKRLSSIQSCRANYADAKINLDLSLPVAPLFAADSKAKPLTVGENTYTLNYDKNAVDFYTDYPCTHFSVYAEAALDETLWESIRAEIAPVIKNKSQEEAVNWLLHFVQKAFKYKTDDDQFGYEKWFFAEETIASSFSDCEDRSILFAQLVRRLLGMPVVLVHYPGAHLATAVKFSNPETTGDYLMVDGAKYLICDPTYINANLGMAMPSLKKKEVEIIKLK